MCSRYVVPEEAALTRHLGVKIKLKNIKPTIYPGYTAPIVMAPNGAELRFWGFITRIPGKRDKTKMLERVMQNAVSETVDEKRTFSGAWNKSQRCLIPVKHFFEPLNREFVAIKDSDQPILLMAGLYNQVTYKEEKRDAYTMLTCEPNKFMEKFHDRMPVILKPEDTEEWLSVDTPPDQAKKLCRPYKGKLVFV